MHQCAEAAPGLQLVGNGDVFAYTDYNEQMASGKLATCMIARGALIKPWIFTGEAGAREARFKTGAATANRLVTGRTLLFCMLDTQRKWKLKCENNSSELKN